MPLLVFALQVGTGGSPTAPYYSERGRMGYLFAAIDESAEATPEAVTPSEQISMVRTGLQATMTDIAAMLGVSRQTLYDWQAGQPVGPGHVALLGKLVRAADSFNGDLRFHQKAIKRPIQGRKSFVELVQAGMSPEPAAQILHAIIQREMGDRKALNARLSNRVRGQDAFEDIGLPHLHDEG